MEFRRIRDLREDSDRTQQEVAEYLLMNLDVYRRYERGIREMPAWAIIKLAGLYRTSTDYIMGLTDVFSPYPASKK